LVVFFLVNVENQNGAFFTNIFTLFINVDLKTQIEQRGSAVKLKKCFSKFKIEIQKKMIAKTR
jgi:hypothetical protein